MIVELKDQGYYDAALTVHDKIFKLTGKHQSIIADVDDNNLFVSFTNNNGEQETLKVTWDYYDFSSNEITEFYESYIEVLAKVIDKISDPVNKNPKSVSENIYKSTLNIFKK